MKSKFILLFLAAALGLACFASPFASEYPDGLDKFAQDHGIDAHEIPFWRKSPMADYAAPVNGGSFLQTGLAGGIGTLLVFGILVFGGRALAASRRENSAEAR